MRRNKNKEDNNKKNKQSTNPRWREHRAQCQLSVAVAHVEHSSRKFEEEKDSKCVCVSVYIPIFDMYSIPTDTNKRGYCLMHISSPLFSPNSRNMQQTIWATTLFCVWALRIRMTNLSLFATFNVQKNVTLTATNRIWDWFPVIEIPDQREAHLRTKAKKNSGCLTAQTNLQCFYRIFSYAILLQYDASIHDDHDHRGPRLHLESLRPADKDLAFDIVPLPLFPAFSSSFSFYPWCLDPLHLRTVHFERVTSC